MEKYIINNLEEFCWSLADDIKRMSIKEMTEENWTLREELEATIRGSTHCSEMKKKKIDK